MVFVNIDLLKQERAKLIDEVKGIEKKVESEKRDYTSLEATRSDILFNQIKAKTAEINRETTKQSLELADFGRKVNRSNKNIELRDEDRAFLNFIRRGRNQLTGEESRALVEDTTGRYLVSPAIEDSLQRSIEQQVVMRQLASKRTVDVDRILAREITEAEVDWGVLETGSLLHESTPVPTPRTIYVEDLAGLVKIGIDELADNDYDLVEYLANSFGRAIAEKENQGFLVGTGHSYSQPDGVCLDTTLLAAAKDTTAPGAVTVEDFLQCIYAVPASIRKGSAWIVNSLTELELRKLRAGGSTTGDGPFLWQPSNIEGRPNTFLGYPIYSQDDMQDLSDTQGVIAAFGRFDLGYRIIDRKGVTIQRLSELYAEAGLVGFLVHARVTGYVVRPQDKRIVLLKEHS